MSSPRIAAANSGYWAACWELGPSIQPDSIRAINRAVVNDVIDDVFTVVSKGLRFRAGAAMLLR
jgi:hypothetical protein